MVFFQDSNLIDKNPIWPLLNQREKLHKSKGPILTKNNGSFELDNLTSDIITKNIKSGILMTVLSLVSKKKRLVIGGIIIYVILTLYLLYFIHKKSKTKKKYDDTGMLISNTDEEKRKKKKISKIKKILLIVLPITYYFISLIMIVSFSRFKYGKLKEITPQIRLQKILENAETNMGDYLYTTPHVNLLKKIISERDKSNMPAMSAKAYLVSGVLIFVLSVIIYFLIKYIKKYPLESKLSLFIILVLGITYGIVYIFTRYKEVIYLFSPSGTSLFGTGNKVHMLIMTCILLFLTFIYIVLVDKKLFGRKFKLQIDTNGQTIIRDKRDIQNTYSQTINDNTDSNSFAISSWFYFNVGEDSKLEYIPVLNLKNKLYLSFNNSNSSIKILALSNDTGLYQQIYQGSIKTQVWNNFLINYNGSHIDVFVNSEFVGTLGISLKDSNSNTINIGSGIKPPSEQSENTCLNKDSVNGGMAQVVYYSNILNIDEIKRNYLIFKNTL
mgnify:CR=1 FL=1